MANTPPPPPAAPALLTDLARSGWSLTLPVKPSWSGPFHYTAYLRSRDVKVAAETRPGFRNRPAETDYALTGPTGRPRLFELWRMGLAQPPEAAVAAAALAASAPCPPPHVCNLVEVLTGAGWRTDVPIIGNPWKGAQQVVTAPDGAIQVAFPAEHNSTDAFWLLIRQSSLGARTLESIATWTTPTRVLAAYLLTADAR